MNQPSQVYQNRDTPNNMIPSRIWNRGREAPNSNGYNQHMGNKAGACWGKSFMQTIDANLKNHFSKAGSEEFRFRRSEEVSVSHGFSNFLVDNFPKQHMSNRQSCSWAPQRMSGLLIA